MRSAIDVGYNVDKLQAHISGKITLESNQIKAIEILLRKKLPDLSSVEHEFLIPDWQLADPAEVSAQAAQVLANNPAYLIEILNAANPAARDAVRRALAEPVPLPGLEQRGLGSHPSSQEVS